MKEQTLLYKHAKSYLNGCTFKFSDSLVCNDISLSRVNRIKHVMKEYFYDWEKKVTITNLPGVQVGEVNSFSKVLS